MHAQIPTGAQESAQHIQAEVELLRSQMDRMIQEVGSVSTHVGAISAVVKQSATDHTAWFGSMEAAIRVLQDNATATAKAVNTFNAPILQAQADLRTMDGRL